MTRLTEYHNGVAVIKGKRYKEAAEKLAKIEDVIEQLKAEKEMAVELYAKATAGDENDLVEVVSYGTQFLTLGRIVKKLEGGGTDE